MSDTKQLIEQLNGRVDNLIARIAESNQLAEKRQAEIAGLNEQLRLKDQTIAQLQAEVERVKLAQNETASQENEQLKSRINEMVREIDECISLLKVEQ